MTYARVINNRYYYYRSQRVEGKVKSIYVGPGGKVPSTATKQGAGEK